MGLRERGGGGRCRESLKKVPNPIVSKVQVLLPISCVYLLWQGFFFSSGKGAGKLLWPLTVGGVLELRKSCSAELAQGLSFALSWGQALLKNECTLGNCCVGGAWEINTSGGKCKSRGVNDERISKQFHYDESSFTWNE